MVRVLVPVVLILLSAYLLFQVLSGEMNMFLGWMLIFLVLPIGFVFGNEPMAAVGTVLIYLFAMVPGMIGLLLLRRGTAHG